MVPPHLLPPPVIAVDEVFPSSSTAPDPNKLQQAFLDGRPCSPELFKKIISAGAALMMSQPAGVRIDAPNVVVVGPVRGQLYDLLHALNGVALGRVSSVGDGPIPETCRHPVSPIPPETNILVLGDMIDGGAYSSQVLLLLLSLKLAHPTQVFLLCGRRETTTQDWGNKGHSILLQHELKQRYKTVPGANAEELWKSCEEVFLALPLAAVVQGKYWCACGGIGPTLHGLEDFRRVDRLHDSRSQGMLCDVVWSDPMDEEDEELHSQALFIHNYEKGCSFNYSYNAVMQFLQDNGLMAIIRSVSFPDSREVLPQVTRQSHNTSGRPWHYQYSYYDPGFRLYRRSPLNNFPVTIGLFSAPRFCGQNENKGAVLVIKDGLIDIRQFPSVPSPFVLPKMQNALQWLIPFVADRARDTAEAMWKAVDLKEGDAYMAIREKIREGRPYDKRMSDLLAFHRLCKLMKKRGRSKGSNVMFNGLASLVPEGAEGAVHAPPTTTLPAYYPASKFPRLAPLQDNWRVIREEALAVCRANKILDLHRPSGAWVGDNAEDFIQGYASEEGWIPSFQSTTGRNYKWLNYGLVHMGTIFAANGATCPRTVEILRKINETGLIRVCGFSWMKAGCSIKPHVDQAGVLDGSLAYHLGLVVSDPHKCILTVDSQPETEEEGK
eukprot:Sspe_Gene.33764::Locus_16454_Transcript_1_2_Confidence_0.667_Length_4396::g.33764::m.33764/K04348/PPP3C, CNA; serine/threonine-protein phosphatase 2B catalytic subunit